MMLIIQTTCVLVALKEAPKLKVFHCNNIGFIAPINLEEFQSYDLGEYEVELLRDEKQTAILKVRKK